MEDMIGKFTNTFCLCRNNFILVGTLLLTLNGASNGYSMQQYCNQEFNFIRKGVSQIQLTFDDNNIYDNTGMIFGKKIYCETTFVAWYSDYSKLMFYFEDLDLGCYDGHLEFYIGQSGITRVSGLSSNICGNNKPQGVFTVDQMYFRIRYVPKRHQKVSDIFSMVITAYGDGYCPSYSHKCDNSRCIDKAIACNDFNSCGDNSDCNLSADSVAGIVVGSLALVGLVICVVVCCICCLRSSGAKPGPVQNTTAPTVTYTAHNQYSQPIYGINQGQPYNPNSQPQPYHDAMRTSIATTASSRQSYSHPMYGVTEESQYTSDPPPYSTVMSNTDNNQQQTQKEAPPPLYSEIIENPAQVTIQS